MKLFNFDFSLMTFYLTCSLLIDINSLIIDINILSLVLNASIIQGFYSFSILQYAPITTLYLDLATLKHLPFCWSSRTTSKPWVGECD